MGYEFYREAKGKEKKSLGSKKLESNREGANRGCMVAL